MHVDVASGKGESLEIFVITGPVLLLFDFVAKVVVRRTGREPMGTPALRQHFVYGRFLRQFNIIFFILLVEDRGIRLVVSLQESIKGSDQGLA